MKKKILLVLLVVLMVGILAFSVFACNKNKGKDPVKPNTPVTPDEPGIDDTDYLGEALGAVVTAIDNTLANVNDIDTAASVSADIVVKVAVGTETYDVSLKVKGSIDENAPAKNWAQIDADVLGVKVSLFAMNDGNKETLYVAQNVLNEDVKWNKLSQFEQANVLSDLACGSILDLVKGIDDKTADSLEAGLVNGYAGQILPMVGMVGSLFQPAEGAGKDFATESGYGIGLNIDELGQLLPTILKLIGGLDLGDATGLVNTIGGIVLGGTLDLGAGSFEPGEHVPTVEIGVGIENELFTGLSLKYAGKIALEEGAEPTDIAINFGIENLSLSGASKAYTKPFTGTPDELAIALNLDLTAQGITADTMTAQVAIYPNVAMTFDKAGYVDFDFSKLYAVATANIAGGNYTIAEYNVDGQEDLIINLSSIANVIGAEVPATQFKVPVNLKEKFDKAMDKTKLNDQAKAYVAKVEEIDADKALKDDEKAKMKSEAYDAAVAFIIKNTVYVTADVDEENTEVSIEDQKKALAKSALDGAIAAITGKASNALDKNVVDYVIGDIIPGLFKDGKFNIGGVVGVIGQLPVIIEELTPVLETEGLFSYELGEDEATASATLNIEVLMDALLAEDGIIDGIEGDWNSFNLWFYTEEQGHYDEDDNWVVDVEESAEQKTLTLAQILAPNAVIDNIVAFVNSAMYDNYLKNFVPATEGEEALGYIEFFADYDPIAFTKTMLIQTLSRIAGATLEEDDAYTNMSISVNGYAQDGIGFGLEATLGEQVKTLGFGLGLSIIENVAVEDYTQKIFFEEKKGYELSYDEEDNAVYTEAYSNDTGKDGGKLLKHVAIKLAQDLVPFLMFYVEDGAGAYGVIMPGASKQLPVETTVNNGSIAVEAGAYAEVWYKVTLDADSTLSVSGVDASKIGCINISFVHPRVGPMDAFLAGEDPGTWQPVPEGMVQVPAGVVYIQVCGYEGGSAIITVANM